MSKLIPKSQKVNIVSSILNQVEIDYSVPIGEVIKIINISPRKRVAYEKLYDLANDGTLLSKENEFKGFFQNIVSACSEAIKLGNARKSNPLGIAVYEPGIQVEEIVRQLIKNNVTFQKFNRRKYAEMMISSFGIYTPDVLVYSPTVKFPVGDMRATVTPQIANAIDPNRIYSGMIGKSSYKLLYQLKIYKYKDQNLTAVSEITLSGKASIISEKIEKFKTYKKPFYKDAVNIYIPILSLDYDSFTKLISPPERELYVKEIYGSEILGVITLLKDFAKSSEALAVVIAKRLIISISELKQNNSTLTASAPVDKHIDNQTFKILDFYMENNKDRDFINAIFKQVLIQSSNNKTLAMKEYDDIVEQIVDPFILVMQDIASSSSNIS